MKLRNRKTGKIVETKENYFYMTFSDDVLPKDGFTSIKNFNEIWEDYKPAEPLIKDKKIRKAVRAWAEALGQREQFLCIKNGTRLEISDGSPHLLYISFWADKSTLDSIDDRTYYTIAELCGEEEE